MNRNKIAKELLIIAKDILTSERYVKEVIREMKELQRLDIDIPRKKFDVKKIEEFFGPEANHMGSRELSDMIDSYLMM